MQSEYKAQANRLQAHLKSVHGISLKHASALEAIAAVHGTRDWNTLLATSSPSAAESVPTPPPTAVSDLPWSQATDFRVNPWPIDLVEGSIHRGLLLLEAVQPSGSRAPYGIKVPGYQYFRAQQTLVLGALLRSLKAWHGVVPIHQLCYSFTNEGISKLYASGNISEQDMDALKSYLLQNADGIKGWDTDRLAMSNIVTTVTRLNTLAAAMPSRMRLMDAYKGGFITKGLDAVAVLTPLSINAVVAELIADTAQMPKADVQELARVLTNHPTFERLTCHLTSAMHEALDGALLKV